jgi:phenylalanyl-tRNA synthetase beta chain
MAYGPVAEEQWGQPVRNVDFFDVKADLEALFAPRTVRFEPAAHPALHPGRSAQVLMNDQAIGFVGELHPRWQQQYELPQAPVLFEVDAAALQERDVPAYHDISKFPAVIRDLALVVKHTLNVQNIIDIFTSESKSNPACRFMQHIVLFDEYRGKGLEADEKSLAFRITLQDTQSTLQDESVESAMTAFIDAVQKKHDAQLRK